MRCYPRDDVIPGEVFLAKIRDHTWAQWDTLNDKTDEGVLEAAGNRVSFYTQCYPRMIR